MPRRRWRRRLLIALPFGLALFLLAGLMLLRSDYLRDRLRVVLEHRLQQRLRHPVRIGSLSGDLLSGVELAGLVVADNQPDVPNLVTVENIRVNYRLRELLYGRLLLTDLVVSRPHIEARLDAGDRLNLLELLPESVPAGSSPTKRRLRVQVARFSLYDGEIALHAPHRNLHVSLAGIQSRWAGPNDRWDHRGELGIRDAHFTLNDAEMSFDQFTTRCTLRDEGGDLQELRIALGNSLLVVTGHLRFPTRESASPFVQADARLQLDLSDLQALLPPAYHVQGVSQTEATLAGTFDEFAGDLRFDLPVIRLNQLPVEHLTLRAAYTEKGLRVTRLSGDLASGQISGEGEIELTDKGPRFVADLKFAGLHLEELAALSAGLLPARVEGTLDGSLELSGTGTDPGTLAGKGNFALRGIRVGDLRLRDSTGDFRLETDQLTLQANLDETPFQLAGRLGLTGPRDLAWKLSGLDLGRLASVFGVTGLAASADLTGSSDGEHPLSASLRIDGAALNGAKVGDVSADFQLANDGSFTQSAQLVHGEGALRLITSGRLEEDLPMTARLEISRWQLDSSELARWGLLEELISAVRCTVQGTLDLRGRLRPAPNQPPLLDGEGQLHLRDASAGEWVLDPTTLPLQIRESALEIPSLGLALGRRGEEARFRVTASGAFDLDRNYRLSLQSVGAQDLASLLRILAPVSGMLLPLDGTLRLATSGSGQIAKPEFSAELLLEQIQYRGQPLGDLRLDLTFREGVVQVAGDAFDGELRLRGSSDLRAGGASQLSFDASALDLSPMLRLAGVSSATMSAQITGNATVLGTPADLHSVQAQVFLPTLQVTMRGESFVNPEPISMTFREGELHLESLSLGDPAGKGRYLQIRDGRILMPLPTTPAALAGVAESIRIESLEIVSEGLPIGQIGRLAGIAAPISGELRYRLSLSGPALNPEATLTWLLPELQIQPANRPPISIRDIGGKLLFSRDELRIEDCRLTIGDYASPGSPLLLRGRLKLDSALDIRLSTEALLLASLSRYMPPGVELKGKLDMEAHLTGTLDRPLLQVDAGLSQGSLRSGMIRPPVETLSGRIRLNADLGDETEPIRVSLTDWELGTGDYRLTVEDVQLGLGIDGLPSALNELLPVIKRLRAGSIEDTFDRLQGQLTSDGIRLRLPAQEWSNSRPVRVVLRDGRLHLLSLAIGEDGRSWIDASGALTLRTGEFATQVGIRQLPLSRLVSLPGIMLGDALLTSRITAQGDWEHPVIEARWLARGTLGELPIRLAGDLGYRDQLLRIDQSAVAATEENIIRLSGSIPLDLSLTQLGLADRFLPQPLDVTLTSKDFRLEPLAGVHPEIDTLEGVLNLALSLRGTTDAPHLEGRVSLSTGALHLKGSGISITEAYLDLRATPEGLDGPYLRLRIGPGRLQVRARTMMAGILPTETQVERCRLDDLQLRHWLPEEVAAKLAGELQVESSWTLPFASLLLPGETAWTPRVRLRTPADLLEVVDGEATIRKLFVQCGTRRIENPAPITFQLRRGEVRLPESVLLSERTESSPGQPAFTLTGKGTVGLMDAPNLHLEAQNFDLGFFAPFLPSNYRLRSTLRATLDLSGTNRAPIATVAWNATDLVVNGSRADVVQGRLSYRDQTLYLGEREDPIRLSMGENHLLLSGEIPTRTPGDGTSADLPIMAQLDAAFGDLRILPALIPSVGQAKGSGEIHLTVGGTRSSPRLRGVAEARGIALDLPESYLRFSNTDIRLELTKQGCRIGEFAGHLNDSPYRVDGEVQWTEPGKLDLRFASPEGFLYDWPHWYRIQFEKLDLRMDGPIRTAGRPALPPIRGNVQISEGRYERDWRTLVQNLLDKPSEAQSEVAFDMPIVRDLQFDLQLAAPEHFFVISDVGKVDLEVALLGRVVGPIKQPIFNGRVDLLRGGLSFMVFRPLFTVMEGSYIENRSDVLFDPYYELRVRTKEPMRGVTLVTTDGDLRTRDLHVRGSVTGRLSDEPTPQFSVEILGKRPGETYQLSQSEILSLLVLGRIDPVFSQATTSAGETSFSDLLLGQSEKLLSQQLAQVLGLRGLELDLDLRDLDRSEFTVSRTLLSRLSLTYTSTFSLHGEPRIGLEYQILRNLAIRGSRDEQGRHSIGIKIEQEF